MAVRRRSGVASAEGDDVNTAAAESIIVMPPFFKAARISLMMRTDLQPAVPLFDVVNFRNLDAQFRFSSRSAAAVFYRLQHETCPCRANRRSLCRSASLRSVTISLLVPTWWPRSSIVTAWMCCKSAGAFVRLRTPQGVEGWTDNRQLMTSAQMDRTSQHDRICS